MLHGVSPGISVEILQVSKWLRGCELYTLWVITECYNVALTKPSKGTNVIRWHQRISGVSADRSE